MEKYIAEEAKEILFKIKTTKDKIEKLSDMRKWNLMLCTAHHNNLLIPAELQETIYILVNTAYENELNKLENELKEL